MLNLNILFVCRFLNKKKKNIPERNAEIWKLITQHVSYSIYIYIHTHAGIIT